MSIATPPAPVAPPTIPTFARPPLPWLLTWLVAVAGVVVVAMELQPVWASKAELTDRFLIPLTSAWLIYRAWPRLMRTPSRPTLTGMPLFAVAAAIFVVGWFTMVQVGAKPIMLWWVVGSGVAALVGLCLAYAGWGRTRLVLFPLLFTLFALPMPGRFENPLQFVLKETVTQATTATLPLLGIPVVRKGYFLTLPSGELGIAEACSGVRSLSGLLAIAVLVAHLKRLRPIRAVALVALSMLAVVGANAVRIITTGVLQEYLGRWAIEGWMHEALGVLVILVGLGLILVLANLVGGRPAPEPDLPAEAVELPPARGGWLACGLAAVAVTGWGVAERYRIGPAAGVAFTEIARDLSGWHGEDITVMPAVSEMLDATQVVHRKYTDRLGREVEVYVIYWATAPTAYAHHPDMCLPAQGMTRLWAGTATIPLDDELPLAPSLRNYARGGLQTLTLYWTQNGPRVLPDGVEEAEVMSGHSYLLALRNGLDGLRQTNRITVQMYTNVRGDRAAAEAVLNSFAAPFAAELYRVCPEAKPRRPATPTADTP